MSTRDTPLPAPRRVAVVHEWLVNHAGSEKVIEQILKLYPQADLFAVVDFLEDHERGFLQGKRAKTTFVQNLPGAQKRFRNYLPLMPLAVEQHDLSGYDLIISSSHAVAKGVLTGPDQLHVCYIHSPVRYAWDMQHQYLQESGMTRGAKGAVARLLLHYMRLWDARTPFGVDQFIANSAFIARRVRKVYRRDAAVIHPPVDVERFTPGTAERGDFYLAASRLVPYKRMPMIVEAFARMPDKKLVVIGDGPEMDKVRAAAGPNVSVLGFQDDAVLVDHMQRAKAFVFAAEEDFGITPVEAQACGTPVIAYGRGGSLETVRGQGRPDQRTGLFFHEQTVEAIVEAIDSFEALPEPIAAQACRAHAEQFSPALFRQRLQAAIDRAWLAFHGDGAIDSAPLDRIAARPVDAPPAEPLAEPLAVPLAAQHPAPARLSHTPKSHPIGEIIRSIRPLSDGDIAQILETQRRTHVRFGEAAVALQLVTQPDVLWALSEQFTYPSARQGDRPRADELSVVIDPTGSQAGAFLDLRNIILSNEVVRGRTPLAIVSPDRGDGRTHVAANLAVTFSRLGERTVLIDGNLRTPALHKVFGLKERNSLVDLLSGRKPMKPLDGSPEFPGLLVLQAGAPPADPLGLLQGPMFGVLLRELQREFDRVIVDTPPARGTTDARWIAAHCRQAVLVGRHGKTEARSMNLLVDRLRSTHAGIAGVVVNAH